MFAFDPSPSTAKPGHEGFSVETRVPTPTKAAPSFSNWTTGRGLPPPWSSMPELDRDTRKPTASRETRTFLAEGIKETTELREEPRRTRGPRGYAEDNYQKIRPSALQKLVKKYDGIGDPHDHVAAYKQVVHAEQVNDTHTQIEGFGLTLESKALTWFQTLEPESKTSLARLEKEFIAAFSKMGIKHNAVAQIFFF